MNTTPQAPSARLSRSRERLRLALNEAPKAPGDSGHRWRVVGGALVLGGLLAWTRPWRWVRLPGVVAGVLPQLLWALLRAPPNRPPAPPVR